MTPAPLNNEAFTPQSRPIPPPPRLGPGPARLAPQSMLGERATSHTAVCPPGGGGTWPQGLAGDGHGRDRQPWLSHPQAWPGSSPRCPGTARDWPGRPAAPHVRRGSGTAHLPRPLPPRGGSTAAGGAHSASSPCWAEMPFVAGQEGQMETGMPHQRQAAQRCGGSSEPRAP